MKTKKIGILLLVMMLMMTSLPLTFATTIRFNNKATQALTETKYDRTYIATSSLKEYGLKTKISGDSITISNSDVKFVMKKNSNEIKVNDIVVTLDATPYFKGTETYVPMKFIFETLNYKVGFDSAKKQITTTKNTDIKFPIKITDSGNTYTFTKPSKKIVSLAPSITEILFAIGAGDLVVGRTKYCTYPAETSKVKSIGTLYEPDLEAILDLEPDTVIAATHMNEDVMKTLEKAKIETLTQTSPAKIKEIYTLIEQLGLLTDKMYESRAVVSSLKSKEERITNIAKTIPTASKKRVYYVVGTGKSEYTAGNQTFINEILVDAGCINVASDVNGWSYTLEKLIEKNPEYLIGGDYSFNDMKASSNYSSLSALKNGKMIEVDTSVFSIPGPRTIDYSMKSIIEKLYPEYAKQLRF